VKNGSFQQLEQSVWVGRATVIQTLLVNNIPSGYFKVADTFSIHPEWILPNEESHISVGSVTTLYQLQQE
jgi:hypothetical protein